MTAAHQKPNQSINNQSCHRQCGWTRSPAGGGLGNVLEPLWKKTTCSVTLWEMSPSCCTFSPSEGGAVPRLCGNKPQFSLRTPSVSRQACELVSSPRQSVSPSAPFKLAVTRRVKGQGSEFKEWKASAPDRQASNSAQVAQQPPDSLFELREAGHRVGRLKLAWVVQPGL